MRPDLIAGAKKEIYSAVLNELLRSDHNDLVLAVVGSSAALHPQIAIEPIAESLAGDKPLAAFLAPHAETSLGLLNNAELWGYTLLVIAVACAGKWGGSALAGRAVGLGWREAGTIGILMNTRGLMELVILNVGRDLGVITPAVFAMMVVMALVTTGMTSPLLHWIYPLRYLQALGSSVPALEANADVLESCLRHGEGDLDNSVVIAEIRRRAAR